MNALGDNLAGVSKACYKHCLDLDLNKKLVPATAVVAVCTHAGQKPRREDDTSLFNKCIEPRYDLQSYPRAACETVQELIEASSSNEERQMGRG